MELRTLRVGAVSYLNTRPLVFGLSGRASHVELVFDLPSRLADRLARRELDVALIPSIEYLLEPSYRIVSNACIACRGPVLSVKLLSRVPMARVRRLAYDEGSRTSVVLARILLQRKLNVAPAFEPLPIGSGVESTDADAVLLIGDRAIHPADSGFVEVWDLGDQWCRWSELPFVFAMWTARACIDTSTLTEPLEQARDAGCAALEAISQQEAPGVGMQDAECLAYLRDNLYFHLGKREQQGLIAFYHHATALGLIPERRRQQNILSFDDCKTY